MGAIDAVGRNNSVDVQNNEPKINKPVTDVNTTESARTSFRTNFFERNFAANYIAARLNFQRPPQPPTPAPQTPNLTTSGSGTDTTYRIGSPTRPNIRHDNGFLQNPNDPNDPTPTATVPPSQADRDYYNDQLNQVTWAQRIDDFNIPFT